MCFFSGRGIPDWGRTFKSDKGGIDYPNHDIHHFLRTDRGSGKRGHDHDNQPGAGYQPDDNHLSYWYHRANARYGG